MTLITGPTAFYTVASRVLQAVVDNIAAGPTEVPRRYGVVPGQIAWDNCEDCGLLAVSLSRVFLTDDFPIESTLHPEGKCTSGWFGADFVLQLIRCAPMPSATGASPTVEALDASAQVVMADAHATLTGVACELAEMLPGEMGGDDSIVDYVIKQQMVVGPSGACVGNQVDFQVAIARIGSAV
jgi:hypothetical protein